VTKTVRRAAPRAWCPGGLALGLGAAVWLGAAPPELPSAAPLPVVRILYTADTQGDLEPCGCSQGQYGGLARRATLLARLREEAPPGVPTLAIDGGALGADARKAPVFAQACRLMRYDLVVLPPGDAPARQAFAEAGVLVLDRPAQGLAACLLSTGGSSVLVLVSPPAEGNAVGPVAQAVAAPVESELRRAELARESTPVVLLSGTPPEATAALAAELQSAVDVVAGLASKGERVATDGVVAGRTREVRTIERGQAVTVIDIALGAEPPSWRIEPVAPGLYGNPEISALVREYYANEAPRAQADPPPAGGTDVVLRGYAEPGECRVCHPKAYVVWRESRHAGALQTLVRSARVVDECLGCHSEAYRQTGACDPEAEEAGVTCATCHGDGVLHSLTGRADTVHRDRGAALCEGCHTAERQQPAFSFGQAWPAIAHGGDA